MTFPQTEEQRKNWEFALQVSRETRANPQSPYAGKYLGIWKQQVVAVADTLDGAMSKLGALQADPRELVCIEASADYEETEYIWESV
jgi:hypothetical protein